MTMTLCNANGTHQWNVSPLVSTQVLRGAHSVYGQSSLCFLPFWKDLCFSSCMYYNCCSLLNQTPWASLKDRSLIFFFYLLCPVELLAHTRYSVEDICCMCYNCKFTCLYHPLVSKVLDRSYSLYKEEPWW